MPILVHLLLMIAAFLYLLAGVSIAMFGRGKRTWLRRHKNLNTAGFGLLAAGVVMVFTGIFLSGGDHLAGIHQQVGAIAVMLAFLTVLLGYDSLKAANKKIVRAAHRWSGRISLVAILVALALGLSMIGIL